MNKQRFIELLQAPENHQPTDISAVESLIDQYPYCQVAHVLMAKITHDTGSMHATKSARRAALYTSDRSKLKNLLDNKPILAEKTSVRLVEEPKDVTPIPVQPIVSVSPPVVEPEPLSAPVENIVSVQQKAELNADAFIQSLQERLAELSALKAKAAGKEIPTPFVNRDKPQPTPEVLSDKGVVPLPSDIAQEKTDKTPPQKISQEPSPEDRRKQIPQLPGFPIHPTNTSNDVLDMILGFDNRVKDYFDLESMTNAAGEKIEVSNEDQINSEEATASDEYKIPFTVRDWSIENSRLEEDSTNLLLNYLDYLREERQKKKRPDKKREQKLIDRFIQEDPSIPPMRSKEVKLQPSDGQEYDESDTLDLTFATETMAKILAEQGKIKEATQVYEALKLKYPEKSAYFADLIKKLS